MHYILDGYNIIKSELMDFSAYRSLEEQRQGLISMLISGNLQGSPKNKITVVFDGNYENSFLGGNSRQDENLLVVFSTDGTADEKIVEMATNYPNKRELVIITDDKGIRRLLGGTGVKFMSVQELRNHLAKTKAKTNTENAPGEGIDPKTAQDIDQELRDKWIK